MRLGKTLTKVTGIEVRQVSEVRENEIGTGDRLRGRNEVRKV